MSNQRVSQNCESVGLRNCTFNFSRQNRSEILTHLREVHNAVYRTGWQFEIRHLEFKTAKEVHERQEWTPVILSSSDKGKGPLFLIVCRLHSPDGYASWKVSHLLETNKCKQRYVARFFFWGENHDMVSQTLIIVLRTKIIYRLKQRIFDSLDRTPGQLQHTP